MEHCCNLKNALPYHHIGGQDRNRARKKIWLQHFWKSGKIWFTKFAFTCIKNGTHP